MSMLPVARRSTTRMPLHYSARQGASLRSDRSRATARREAATVRHLEQRRNHAGNFVETASGAPDAGSKQATLVIGCKGRLNNPRPRLFDNLPGIHHGERAAQLGTTARSWYDMSHAQTFFEIRNERKPGLDGHVERSVGSSAISSRVRRQVHGNDGAAASAGQSMRYRRCADVDRECRQIEQFHALAGCLPSFPLVHKDDSAICARS